MTLVDTCVWLDVLGSDPRWADWSSRQLELAHRRGGVVVNPVVYAELSVGFDRIEHLDKILRDFPARFEHLPHDALFLAGKAFARYRRRGGKRASVLPDFFIGAHAAVRAWPVLTRDVTRIHAYFPTVTLWSPDSS